MPIIPLLKTRNYFISSQGHVIKIENGKEVIVKASRTPRSREVRVFIDKRECNLLHLMIQHFIGDIKITDKVKFTVNKDLEIPLNSIIIKPALGIINVLSPEDEALMFRWKCQNKANGSNGRAGEKLTAIQVFRTLLIHDFKCIYCLDQLHPRSWHLDHFKALSTGGKNIIENIVPACGPCNIMKGALDGNQFYSKCVKISQMYMFKETTPVKEIYKTA